MQNNLKQFCKDLGWLLLALVIVVSILILVVLCFQGVTVIHDYLH